VPSTPGWNEGGTADHRILLEARWAIAGTPEPMSIVDADSDTVVITYA
jgi:hypothetical protein